MQPTEDALRLVVSNGSRQVEKFMEGSWKTVNVQNDGNLRKGVYPLYEAKQAKTDDKQLFAGTVIHADKRHVYQELGKNNIVRHDRSTFDQTPTIGQFTKIQYNLGRAQVVDKTQSQSLGVGRHLGLNAR